MNTDNLIGTEIVYSKYVCIKGPVIVVCHMLHDVFNNEWFEDDMSTSGYEWSRTQHWSRVKSLKTMGDNLELQLVDGITIFVKKDHFDAK